MANIRKLKDSNGEDIYPITFTDAVYTNDGRTIEDIINQMSTVEQQITQYENNNSQIRESIINLLKKHGIDYNGSDSLTTLIGKIPVGAGGSTESNGNNGLQYATGSMGLNVRLYDGETFKRKTVSLDEELPFTPSIIFIHISEISEAISSSSNFEYKNLVISTEFPFTSNNYTSNEITVVPKEKSFDIEFYSPEEEEGIFTYSGATCNWYAFGESESSSEGGSTGTGLNIISAAELPATGVENQVCVITDNPVDTFNISPNSIDFNEEDANCINVYMSSDIESAQANFTVINNNIIQTYYIDRVTQNGNGKESYIYKNNTWELLTKNVIFIYDNGTANSLFGTINTQGNTQDGFVDNGTTFTMKTPSSTYTYIRVSFTEYVDFSNYSKLIVTGISDYSGNVLYAGIATNDWTWAENGFSYVPTKQLITTTDYGSKCDYVFDISSWNSSGYFCLVFDGFGKTSNIQISEIKIS